MKPLFYYPETFLTWKFQFNWNVINICKYVMRKIKSANTDNIHVIVVSLTSSNFLTFLIKLVFVFVYFSHQGL